MTTPTTVLPRLGAALPLADLPAHRDWLREGDRDLELQDFHEAEVLEGDWRPTADAILRELQGWHGRLGVHGPFWGFGIASKDPQVRALVARRMDQGLDVCAHLGATQMVIHSPYTTWDYNNLDDHADARAEIVARTHDTLAGAVKRAEALGVVLVIENIEDKDPMPGSRWRASFDSAFVRVSLDTGHANYAHGSTGAPPVDYYVHAAGEMLHHVHLQDTDGYADRHWAPGEGNIRWEALFRALARLEGQPRLILELRRRSEVLKGARFLTGLGLAL